VLIAAKPREIAPIFTGGSGQGWGAPARDLLTSSPEDAAGVYVVTLRGAAGNTEDELKQYIGKRLTGNAVLRLDETHRNATIAGFPGDEFEGTLTDPTSPTTQLHATVDLVHLDTGTATLIFFAPTDRFEDERPVFREMLNSLRLVP
jgi:hypothetical protein